MTTHVKPIHSMKHFLPLLLLLTLLFSCDGSSVQERIDHAQLALERSDYRSAKSICDELLSVQSKSSSKDAATLSNLSILYMKLSETDDRDDNIGNAYQCYRDAFATDSAAACDYYNNLPVEDLPYSTLLSSIVKSTDTGTDISDEYVEEDDSL